MISRWISEVPSTIWSTLASRSHFSTGWSRMIPAPPSTCTASVVMRMAVSAANALAYEPARPTSSPASRSAAARDRSSRAAALLDAGEDAGLAGSYAKAFAADTAMRITTDAVQVLGGAGIMRDHPVEKWLRDAKVLQIVEGTSEIQREIAARYLKRGVRERP